MKRLNLALLSLLLCLALLARGAARAATELNLCIVVVGDETNPRAVALENEIVQMMHDNLDEEHKPRSFVPVLVYHVNKANERDYCQKKLGVEPHEAVFVGLAVHQNLVVKQIIFRQSNIDNAERALVRITERVAEANGVVPEELHPGGAPSPQVSASVAPPTTGGGADVELTRTGMYKAVENGNPLSLTDHYGPEDIFWFYTRANNMHAGDVVEIRWLYKGRLITMSDGRAAVYQYIVKPTSLPYLQFRLGGGSRFPAGHYNAVLTINGEERANLPFEVVGY